MDRLLGIDIGSSAVKAALFDRAGSQVSVSRVPCASAGEFAPAGWAEAMVRALAALDLRAVAAVGLCGRGGTNVFLDEAGDAVAPSWDDPRHEQDLRTLREQHGDVLPSQSLNLLAKARWWHREHGPVHRAMSAKDYVTRALTGSFATDPASGGTSSASVPPLLPASPAWSLAGHTNGNNDLPAGIPVAVGWHDGAAATFGSGAAAEGTAPVTLGTNAVYRIVSPTIPAPLRKYWDLTPGLTVTGGDILAAGRAWAWASSLFPGADASQSAPGANGVTFLPQLAGRIAPDVNRSARAAWHGLDGAQQPADLLRAVGEGIAFSIRQVRDWLAANSLAANRTVATGGGAHDTFEAQLLADVLQQPILVADCEEGCRGAALLAAVAAGLMSLEEARTLLPQYVSFDPDPSLAAVYDDAYARFLACQEATDRAWPPK